MFRTFSLKNILWGILLGLMFVGVWMYYPEILNHLKSSIPESKEKVTVLLRDQEERLKPYVEKISTRLAEKRDALVSLSSKEENEPAGVHDPISLEDLSQEPEAKKGIEPYYAREEFKWQELMGRSLQPDHVDAYPYHECFEAGASEHKLPLSLVLGLAGYLSNFDPDSFMDQKAGIMHLGWPDPSKGMGIQKREELINDPCMNIKLACRFLTDLLTQDNGEWVPALVAYRDQVSLVRRDRITRENLIFSAQLRSQVEKVLQRPFEKRGMYSFLAFNKRKTAEDFMASIKESTGVDLWVGQKGYMYMVFIPAVDEEEKNHKETLISEKAGIIVR